MEDTIKIRKDYIKNIAIIFLTVMLILTFFSNSIMNFSLPEVATQSIKRQTITEKVRGSGTVTAEDPYKLIVEESRVIESVLVKKGDEVKKDQVIIKLEEKDSDELAKAEMELEALNFSLMQKILSGEISAESFSYAQSGKRFSITQYQQRIQAANDRVTAAQNNVKKLTGDVNAIQKQLDLLENKVVDTSDEQEEYDDANEDLNNANERLSKAENNVNYCKEILDSISEEERTENEEHYQELVEALDKARIEEKNARDEVAERTNDVANAKANLDRVSATNSQDADKAALSNQLTEAKASLTSATTELEAAKEEQAKVVKDIQTELDVSNQNTLISEKEKEIERLKAKSLGNEIKSPVDGIIMTIAKTAGESTVPAEELATIQVAGKGFTTSFSVTNEQAKKVKVGDSADLQNAWYYEDVRVLLKKIQADTEDPGKKKKLVFSVEGNVADGETLNLSIGQRSAEYDYTVPNSAVKEDKNGKFILIIEEKSTPFGNRYKAKRVDVEVLASDDNNTAIKADIEGYEYVITTSNKPVDAGKQVRLSDN